MTKYIDIVFDGPPGPASPRFVEVEDASGRSIGIGRWEQRPDGYWALRVTRADIERVLLPGEEPKPCP